MRPEFCAQIARPAPIGLRGARAMSVSASDRWAELVQAWIAEQGDHCDTTVVVFVFDAPMIARIDHLHFKRAPDVGCGRADFVANTTLHIRTIGVDRQISLFVARDCRTPQGDYRIGCADMMEIDEPVDLVVSYLILA